MDTYGLVGHPLTHSFSKKYFTDKFEMECIDAQYLNFDIGDIELLPQIIADHKNLKGLSVTIPYKQQIIPRLNELAPAARAIGAVNTIVVKNGKLIGYNTDYIGFGQSIKPLLNNIDKHALVLGNGGASKATIYALQKMGMDVTLVSRKPTHQSITYDALNEDIITNHSIIVNTTPIGMYPDVQYAPPIPYQYLNKSHLLFDLIYNPTETIFLRHAKQVGARYKNGLDMLHMQAEAAWAIWNEL